MCLLGMVPERLVHIPQSQMMVQQAREVNHSLRDGVGATIVQDGQEGVHQPPARTSWGTSAPSEEHGMYLLRCW